MSRAERRAASCMGFRPVRRSPERTDPPEPWPPGDHWL